MGGKTTKQVRLISDSEITSTLSEQQNQRLMNLYSNNKDSNGFINEQNLNKVLDGIMSEELVKLFYISIPIHENKFSIEDLKYLYCLLVSDKRNLKLSLLESLIFQKEDKIEESLYINNIINLFYNENNAVNKLISNDFISEFRRNGKIIKTELYSSKLSNCISISSFISAKDIIKLYEDHMLYNSNNLNNIKNENKNDEVISDKKGNMKDLELNKINKNSKFLINLLNILKGNSSNLDSTGDSNLIISHNLINIDKINNNNIIVPLFFHFYCECHMLEYELLMKSTNDINNIPMVKRFSKSFFNNSTKGLPNLKENALFHNNLELMKSKFRIFENENNGVFPLILVEKMLFEIGVDSYLSFIIINYLKNKTHKTFLMFEQFKWLIEKFSQEDFDMLISHLFRLLSNDKNELSCKDLSQFLRKYSKITDKEINDILTNYNLNKDKYISLETFTVLFKDNEYSISENIEKIKYIPFIYFEIPCDEKNKQKNCIKLLLKDRSLVDYIYDNIELGRKYNIINKEFFEDWCDYVDFAEYNNINKATNTHGNNHEEEFNSNNHNNFEIKNSSDIKHRSRRFLKKAKPSINLSILVSSHNKLKHNLQYEKDFLLVTEVMYDLFVSWYTGVGSDLSRIAIQTDYTDCLTQKLAIEVKSQISNNSFSLNYSSEVVTKRYLEIEIYPVFISFMKIDYMSSIIEDNIDDNLKLNIIKEGGLTEKRYNKLIRQILKAKREAGAFKAIPYSRTTTFTRILNKFSDLGQIKKNTKIWLISENKFYIPEESSSFETENSDKNVIIIFDQNIDGKWEKEVFYEQLIDKYFKTETDKIKKRISKDETSADEEKQRQKKLLEEENNKVMVGMRNLGNCKKR